MVQQVINVGAAANDGTGDPLRTAMQKSNANFTELYAASVPDMGDYITGNYYQFPFSNGTTGNNITANAIRLVPVLLLKGCTVDALGARLTTAAGAGSWKAAVYANDPATGLPTGIPLASTGDISAAVAGIFSSATLEGDVALAPGIYWTAVWADNNANIFKAQAGASGLAPWLVGSATEANISSGAVVSTITYTWALAYGAWPDLTGAAPTESNVIACAQIHFRVA